MMQSRTREKNPFAWDREIDSQVICSLHAILATALGGTVSNRGVALMQFRLNLPVDLRRRRKGTRVPPPE